MDEYMTWLYLCPHLDVSLLAGLTPCGRLAGMRHAFVQDRFARHDLLLRTTVGLNNDVTRPGNPFFPAITVVQHRVMENGDQDHNPNSESDWSSFLLVLE